MLLPVNLNVLNTVLKPVLCTYDSFTPEVVKREIKKVFTFGASIINQSFSYEGRLDTETKYKDLGLDITVVNYAVSQDTTQMMIARLPGMLADGAADASTTLIVMHGGGNTIGNYPDNAQELDDDLRYMASEIKAAGYMLAMSNITQRIAPASRMSEPYNENVVNDIVAEFADIPLDLHGLTVDNTPAWYEPDGTHPSLFGEDLNRDYVTKTTSKYIKNVEIPVAGIYLEDALLQFGSRDVMSGGLNNVPPTSSGDEFLEMDVYNTDYTQVPNGIIRVQHTDKRNGSGRGDPVEPSDTTLSITNSRGLSDSYYIDDSNRDIVVDLTDAKLDPMANYLVEVTASRDTTDPTGLDRVSLISIGADTVISIDATLDPPQVGNTILLGSEIMSHMVSCTKLEESSFGYISLMRIRKYDNV